MSQDFIINASPLVVERGTNDLSTRQVLPSPIPTPQHLPLTFFYAEKGPTTKQLVAGAARLNLYGQKTFDSTSKFFNHSTLFSNAINAKGNVQMHQRLVPTDANPEANVRLYLEVVPSLVPALIRGADGTPTLDVSGNVQPTADTIVGHKVRIVREVITGPMTVGDASQKAGALTGTTGTATLTPPNSGAPASLTVATATSIMYPLMDIKASSQGAFANNSGVRFYPATGDKVASKYLTKTKSYPYFLSVINRLDANTAPTIIPNLFGEKASTVTLSPNSVNPYNGAQVSLDNILPAKFENIDDPSLPLEYSDIGDVHVYYNDIQSAATALITDEAGWAAPGITAFDWNSIDYTSIVTYDSMILNMLGNESASGAQYYTIEQDVVSAAAANETVVVTSTTNNIYMVGGSDGTMNEIGFETLVSSYMAQYLDPNSQVQDTAINVESIIYDSGYTNTMGSTFGKGALIDFLGQRKDTFVVSSSYDPMDPNAKNGTQPMLLSDELAVATSLKTRFSLFPESTYYGTGVARGMIIGQSGLIRNSLWKKRVPMTYEIAVKSAEYMGAGNQEWTNGKSFDSAPGNIITSTYDLQPAFIPANTKFTLWNTGLVWAQPFDRRTFFFPALQTVYEDDTSVLNSYFTALAIGYLNKVAWKTWRNFTGISSVNNAQLAERVNRFVENELTNKFDGKFVVYADTLFTAQDELRGYSWTLVFKLYSPNMKTVMTTSVEVYRLSDLTTK